MIRQSNIAIQLLLDYLSSQISIPVIQDFHHYNTNINYKLRDLIRYWKNNMNQSILNIQLVEVIKCFEIPNNAQRTTMCIINRGDVLMLRVLQEIDSA